MMRKVKLAAIWDEKDVAFIHLFGMAVIDEVLNKLSIQLLICPGLVLRKLLVYRLKHPDRCIA